jgi:hypothetical protein
MSDRKALLDRMAHRTAPVESSLFDVVETPGAGQAAEAPAAGGNTPGQARNRPVAAPGAPSGPDVGPEPAPPPPTRSGAQEPVPPAAPEAGGGALIQVYTAITSDAEGSLHRAAFDGPAGGDGQKSRLVREAIDALLADYDAADGEARARLRELMRRRPEGVRITRYYRIETATKERLSAFGRDERIPSAAALRVAIERRFGPSSG